MVIGHLRPGWRRATDRFPITWIGGSDPFRSINRLDTMASLHGRCPICMKRGQMVTRKSVELATPSKGCSCSTSSDC